MDMERIASRLSAFLDSSGRLTQFPRRREVRLLALFYLADKFDRSSEYGELEVNAVLKRWHTFDDWFTIRRALCDYKFLDRARDGSAYRLSSPPPSPADFNLEV